MLFEQMSLPLERRGPVVGWTAGTGMFSRHVQTQQMFPREALLPKVHR